MSELLHASIRPCPQPFRVGRVTLEQPVRSRGAADWDNANAASVAGRCAKARVLLHRALRACSQRVCARRTRQLGRRSASGRAAYRELAFAYLKAPAKHDSNTVLRYLSAPGETFRLSGAMGISLLCSDSRQSVTSWRTFTSSVRRRTRTLPRASSATHTRFGLAHRGIH